MDGTFLGTYESKLSNWESLIKSDPGNAHIYQMDMDKYMVNCLPFMWRYMNKDCKEEEELNSVFNIVTKKGLKRREIYHDYLRSVEDFKGVFPKENNKFENKKQIKKQAYNSKLCEIFECKNCKSKNVYYEQETAQNICTDCGCAEQQLGEELTYKEEQEQNEKMVVQCGYKKENHLNEWILQFQGQEVTNIPDSVIEQLRGEFKKQKIKKVTEITREKVRTFLKKLKLTKYYEHSTHITHILNGLKPPDMSQALEDRLRLMFKEIQEPFEHNCPPERNNFLSYSYVLYKFCELLEEDDFLPFFPLLKSKEKLHQQDVIWKKMCKELQWEFIPTI